MFDLLMEAAERGVRYLSGLNDRRGSPAAAAISRLADLGGPLPDAPTDPALVLKLLDDLGSPATVASAGGRYFGFVVGGALPVTVAANWLAGAWDQNAGLIVSSPVGAAVEEITLGWLVDVLALPYGTAGAFVTGATMANFTALAAARHAALAGVGWDVEAHGLFGAPPITVVVGDHVHVSLLKALTMLGLGRDRVVRVPADEEGRMRLDAVPAFAPPAIVCLQAGNVNSGAFDPARELCPIAHRAGAWVHVDGAFGLWAAAAPTRSHLADGVALADSWAVDAHKWLNVPYDSGIAFVRDEAALTASMSASAAYLVQQAGREPHLHTPEMSRRARAVEVWAALRHLGRSGLADLVERTCRYAERLAVGLRRAGHRVLNEVVLNQVLVSFGEGETTRRVIQAVQADGTCWVGGTVWHGRPAMRLSVSSWATTEHDIERSLAAILRTAASAR
jgi:glutamate/tyrosine decarboxylase-like PLP-dependent enzyme